MRNIILIALNTTREIMSNRILYILFFFSLLLISFSVALGEMSFAEQERIIADTGLTSIHLVMMILAIFLGNSLLTREFERQTYMTILSRPVSRLDFLLGKFFGLLIMISLVLLGLLIVLAFIIFGSELFSPLKWFWIYLGFVAEAAVLISVTLLFSVFIESLVAVPSAIAVFLVGHWLTDLSYFAEKSKSVVFKNLAFIVRYGLPDLEKLNWRSTVHFAINIDSGTILMGVLHGLSWTFLFMLIGVLLLNRKDLT